MATQPVTPHIWYSPAECAAMLDGIAHRDGWRAKCPAHAGDNPQSLGIKQGRDKHGNPITLMHCFAHDCSIEDICAAMGIQVRNLFCMTPDYYKTMRPFPPAKSPRIARLKYMEEPSEDEIAQILLEEMIVSDPEWIQTCAPARQKMWELAQADPVIREKLTKALYGARLHPPQFWARLAAEMKKA